MIADRIVIARDSSDLLHRAFGQGPPALRPRAGVPALLAATRWPANGVDRSASQRIRGCSRAVRSATSFAVTALPKPAAQLVETLRPRRDGGSHILGEAGIDTDVAGIEIKSRAGLFGAGKAQLPKQIAIHRVSLGAARADNIEIAVAKAFERAARDVEFAQRIGFELLCQTPECR